MKNKSIKFSLILGQKFGFSRRHHEEPQHSTKTKTKEIIGSQQMSEFQLLTRTQGEDSDCDRGGVNFTSKKFCGLTFS